MIDFDAPDDFNPACPRSTPRAGRPLVWAAALAALVALNAFAVLRWTSRDTRPLAWDEAVHTRNTFEYQERLEKGAPLFRPVYFNYPPLYNLTVLPFLNAAADVADAGAWPNVGYLALLVVAVFLIGRRLADEWVGMAAAILIGFYPMVAFMARQTMLDLALTAWVAWAFYALVRCEGFSRAGWAAAFGVFLGLGMLTKWTAAIYLAGPAAPALWAAARTRGWRGVGAAALCALAVMAPWYAQNAVPMLARVTAIKDLPPAGGTILSGLASVLWYPLGLFEQLNLPFLLLFVFGFILSFKRAEFRPVLLWFVVSIALFTLITNRNTRYSLPALPAAALLSVAWVRGRPAGFALVSLIAAVFFVLFNFTAPAPTMAHIGGLTLPVFHNQPPQAADWKHREIVEAVKAARAGASGFDRITVVANAPYLHSTTLNITARGLGADNFSFRGPSKKRWLDFATFILLKTGDLGPEFTIKNIKENAAFIAEAPAWFGEVYKEIGRWSLPDGSEAILFRANPDPRPVSENESFNMTVTQMDLPNVTAHDVEVVALPISATDTARGLLGRVDVRASTVSYKGIQVTGVHLALARPQINLPRYRDEGDVQMLALDRIGVSATVDAATIEAYARKKAKWLKNPSVDFAGERVTVSGAAGPVAIKIAVDLAVDDGTLTPRLRALTVGGVPLPTVFFRALTDRAVPLAPNREWPYFIDIGRISGEGKILRVGA